MYLDDKIFELNEREEKLLKEFKQKKQIYLLKARRMGAKPNFMDYISLQQKIKGLEMAKKLREYQEMYRLAWIEIDSLLEKEFKRIKGL